MWICIAPYRHHTSKALRYGTRSQEISQFYLHTLRTSANGMNHACLLPSQPKLALIMTHLPIPEGWKAELALGGWLVTYRNKCRAPGIELGHGRPSQY